ncbi:fumarylacetoacetate hydrolase family protein [Dactylosporangium sp. NPDC000555]|uniref:fumarylacetoacetate hydrolase family protein n=1 Tax=Dactylosporangium sp. NPDC000555 TaxID=3154260 RepID=UPI00332B2649
MTSVQVVSTVFGVGRVENDEIAVLDTPFPHVGAVIEATGSLDVLTRSPVRQRVPLQGAALLAPLGTPRSVWGVGLNYRSKAAHTGRGLPSEPILYLGAPSAVLAPDAEVAIPTGRTAEMDYEGEIAIVIGRRLYRAAAEQVWPSVAGITAANDMTARDVMRATAAPTLAKSFPGFNPLGASVCTVDEFADRDRIPIRTWLNGELRQDDTSDGMIFSVPDLLARISWFAALEPGDVVLTGTPAGTGQDRGSYLGPGDRIRIEVGPVLPLVTTVEAPSRDRPDAG